MKKVCSRQVHPQGPQASFTLKLILHVSCVDRDFRLPKVQQETVRRSGALP